MDVVYGTYGAIRCGSTHIKGWNPSHTQKRSDNRTHSTLRSNTIYLLGYPLQYGYDYSPCISHQLIRCREDTGWVVKENMRTKRESMLSLFACKLYIGYVVMAYRQADKSVSLHIGWLISKASPKIGFSPVFGLVVFIYPSHSYPQCVLFIILL